MQEIAEASLSIEEQFNKTFEVLKVAQEQDEMQNAERQEEDEEERRIDAENLKMMDPQEILKAAWGRGGGVGVMKDIVAWFEIGREDVSCEEVGWQCEIAPNPNKPN